MIGVVMGVDEMSYGLVGYIANRILDLSANSRRGINKNDSFILDKKKTPMSFLC